MNINIGGSCIFKVVFFKYFMLSDDLKLDEEICNVFNFVMFNYITVIKCNIE